MCIHTTSSLFICQWTPKLLPHFGYCKQCLNEHWCACIFSNYGFLWYMPMSGIAGSYSSIFSFLRSLHTVLLNGCNNLHSHQQCFLHTLSSIYCLKIFYRWPFWLVWGGISLDLHISDNYVEHLVMCFLGICMSSLEKCLGRSSTHFLSGCLFFWYWASWAVCKFWRLIPCWSHYFQIFSTILWVVFFILFMVCCAKALEFN